MDGIKYAQYIRTELDIRIRSFQNRIDGNQLKSRRNKICLWNKIEQIRQNTLDKKGNI